MKDVAASASEGSSSVFPGPSELELSEAQMREMTEQAIERITAFIGSLPEQPAHDLDGAEELARALIEPLPETGEPFEQLLARLFDEVVVKAFNTAAPGYLAYIPGGGLYHSALADLIADSVNRFTSIWTPAPGLAQIEAVAVRWLCEIVGYPDNALGLLTTGGSLANFTAIFTARRGAPAGKLPVGHDLRVRSGAPLHPEGRDPGRLPHFGGARNRQRRRIPHAPRPPRGAHLRRPRRRQAAADDRRQRRHHQHRRRRRSRRSRRHRRPRRSVVSRRRGVRRVLHAHRAGQGNPQRPRKVRFAVTRSPQGHVPALRHRLLAGARRRNVGPGPRRGRRLPADHAGRSRLRPTSARSRPSCRATTAACASGCP